MERQSVNSSNLRSIGYDHSSSTLEIEFNNGSVYQYFSVPASVYEELMNASSHGQYFDQQVKKGGYRFSRAN